MSCALYVNSCCRFRPHLLRSFLNSSDHTWSHTCKHTGTELTDTHKQTDASVCHPSLSAWTSPKRTELAKCCCPGTWFSIFQLLSHQNISVEFAFCCSRFSYFSNDLHFVFFLPPSISYRFLFPTLSRSLAVYSLWSNPESQWISRLMQRIREELGIQFEKIRLLSFQADI